MDLTVVTTYRCDSKCRMCHVWQHPTAPAEEVSPATLERLPAGLDHVNVSGGEPTLRRDLGELVDVLAPKARVIEISSNGLHADKLLPLVQKYPAIKIRFSLEGLAGTNDDIRGENNGFERKVAGLRMLREAGGRDLGFATVVQDGNAAELATVYDLARAEGVELATSALHNGWQFYKNDNTFDDRVRVARALEQLIRRQLERSDVKTWFRAYLNYGLLERVLGRPRLLACTAASDFAFVDPWADVWACNVRTDLRLGNLAREDWNAIMTGPEANRIRDEVKACPQNCWMVTTARTAMRSRLSARLPKLEPLAWVLKHRLRVLAGADIDLVGRAGVTPARADAPAPAPLDRRMKIKLQRHRETVAERYPLRDFHNR